MAMLKVHHLTGLGRLRAKTHRIRRMRTTPLTRDFSPPILRTAGQSGADQISLAPIMGSSNARSTSHVRLTDSRASSGGLHHGINMS